MMCFQCQGRERGKDTWTGAAGTHGPEEGTKEESGSRAGAGGPVLPVAHSDELALLRQFCSVCRPQHC